MDQASDRATAVSTPSDAPRVHVTVATSPEPDALRRWDRLVATIPGADVAQLSAWARVRRQAGFAPVHVFVEDTGRLVGGALVLCRTLPVLGGVAYLPYGPLLTADAPPAAADAVCRALARMPGRRLAALFVQPPRGAYDVSERLLRLGLRPSAAGIAPAASLELDLSRPVHEIRRNVRSGARSGIRQASARVTVREAGEPDLPAVAELLAATAAHHGFAPPSVGYLQALHRQLEPAGHVKAFVAECGGVPVAAQVLTYCGDTATLRLTGMHRSDRTPPGTAAHLQWSTIMWAREAGYHRFDFGGIAPSTVDAIRAGRAGLASRVNGRDYFKTSFGGHPFRHPQPVELFSSAATRTAYDLARRSELGRRALRHARSLLRGTARTSG